MENNQILSEKVYFKETKAFNVLQTAVLANSMLKDIALPNIIPDSVQFCIIRLQGDLVIQQPPNLWLLLSVRLEKFDCMHKSRLIWALSHVTDLCSTIDGLVLQHATSFVSHTPMHLSGTYDTVLL